MLAAAVFALAALSFEPPGRLEVMKMIKPTTSTAPMPKATRSGRLDFRAGSVAEAFCSGDLNVGAGAAMVETNSSGFCSGCGLAMVGGISCFVSSGFNNSVGGGSVCLA
jgi:hypothetical protein